MCRQRVYSDTQLLSSRPPVVPREKTPVHRAKRASHRRTDRTPQALSQQIDILPALKREDSHGTTGLGWLRLVATTLGGYWLCQLTGTPIPAWDSEILVDCIPIPTRKLCLPPGIGESRHRPIRWAGKPPRLPIGMTDRHLKTSTRNIKYLL